MNKKIMLSLATLTSLAAPIATVVACGQDVEKPIFYDVISDRFRQNILPILGPEYSVYEYVYPDLKDQDKEKYEHEFLDETLSHILVLDSNKNYLVPEISWDKEIDHKKAGTYSATLKATDAQKNSSELKINFVLSDVPIKFSTNSLNISSEYYSVQGLENNSGFLSLSKDLSVTAANIENLIKPYEVNLKGKDSNISTILSSDKITYTWEKTFNPNVSGTYILKVTANHAANNKTWTADYKLEVIVN